MMAWLLRRHLRHPRGWVGRFVGVYMNRLNRVMNTSVVTALNPAPSDRVLELGFGGGVGIELLAPRLSSGRLYGLECSSAMLSAARSRFRPLLDRGLLELQSGSATSIPYPSASFDAVCSVNTLYFWDDLPAALREIQRVLAPRGRLALGFRARTAIGNLPITRRGFSLYEPEEVAAVLQQHGFDVLQVTSGNDAKLGFSVIVAERRA